MEWLFVSQLNLANQNNGQVSEPQHFRHLRFKLTTKFQEQSTNNTFLPENGQHFILFTVYATDQSICHFTNNSMHKPRDITLL